MIDPKRIAAQVAVRILHLQGSDQAALQAAYAAMLLSPAAGGDGADVPYGSIVDSVVASEARLAAMIASDITHPYRKDLYGRSDLIVSGDEIPSVSDAAESFIGLFSQISDGENDMALTEQPIQVVRRHLRGSYKTDIYYYSMHDSRIYHTRESVMFEGCVWSRDTAFGRFAVDNSDPSPLPDAVESLWIADTIASMPNEGWNADLGSYYGSFAERGMQLLASRAAPGVLDAISTAEPVKG